MPEMEGEDVGQVVLPVEGMTCGGCVASVERALQRLPEVSAAAATLTPGTVTVTLVPGSRLSRGALVAVVEGAGFRVPA